MSTRNRFQKYVELEDMVVERIKAVGDPWGIISKVTPAPAGETYDRVLVTKGRREIRLEIQITESSGFERYGDVRLDLISAFQHLYWSDFKDRPFIPPALVDDFLSSIHMDRRGKLYQCQADILAFYVTEPTDLLWLFSVPALQERRGYFVGEYGIYVNKKSKDERWESCFVAVSEDDEELTKCGAKFRGTVPVVGENEKAGEREGEKARRKSDILFQ